MLAPPRAELGFVDQPHSVGVEDSREGLSVAMVLMCRAEIWTNGQLPLRNVVAPSLENLRAALDVASSAFVPPGRTETNCG